MSQKCVRQGCGKLYTDPNEVCRYHTGPPVFHEGQKGWKCCKPRVFSFEDFLEIEPCTEGKHSTTDRPPTLETREADASIFQNLTNFSAAMASPALLRAPINTPTPTKITAPPPPESDDDDDSLEIPHGRKCRRRACGVDYAKGFMRNDNEKCVHHPGLPIFHEGSKGYTCCKRRVLEFDQFLKIAGCQTKPRHLFIGSGNKDRPGTHGSEELLQTVRTDFYQTSCSVIASFFLAKIDKDAAKVVFTQSSVQLDLPTTGSPVKRYKAEVPLFGLINPEKTTHKILGTKLEVTLAKAEVVSWPVLRADDRLTGEILQVGRAGKV